MSNNERSFVAAKLKEAREYLEISQEEVAAATGISRSAISLIESAQRKVDSIELMKLSKLYRLPLSSFSSEGDTPNINNFQATVLARNFEKLSASDREELLKFSEFLSMKSSGKS